jgi:hypothetical protein
MKRAARSGAAFTEYYSEQPSPPAAETDEADAASASMQDAAQAGAPFAEPAA